MAKKSFVLNNEVTDLLDALNHPFRNEIELLRKLILSTKNNLKEVIKWNGPSYCYSEEDRITMKVQPPAKQVSIIFHRGAKKQDQPKEKLIANKSKLLNWKENDRAILTIKSLQEIEKAKAELVSIIDEWIEATK